jgi:hypothetical protein
MAEAKAKVEALT